MLQYFEWLFSHDFFYTIYYIYPIYCTVILTTFYFKVIFFIFIIKKLLILAEPGKTTCKNMKNLTFATYKTSTLGYHFFWKKGKKNRIVKVNNFNISKSIRNLQDFIVVRKKLEKCFLKIFATAYLKMWVERLGHNDNT